MRAGYTRVLCWTPVRIIELAPPQKPLARRFAAKLANRAASDRDSWQLQCEPVESSR